MIKDLLQKSSCLIYPFKASFYSVCLVIKNTCCGVSQFFCPQQEATSRKRSDSHCDIYARGTLPHSPGTKIAGEDQGLLKWDPLAISSKRSCRHDKHIDSFIVVNFHVLIIIITRSSKLQLNF